MLRHEQFGSSGWQFDASLVELLGCDIGRDQGRGHSIGADGGNKGGAGTASGSGRKLTKNSAPLA
jgi:hypothetical protein